MKDKLISLNTLEKEIEHGFDMQDVYLPIHFLEATECVEEGIIRCKDCKHRPIRSKNYKNGFDLNFPDYECPCNCVDPFYSWYPDDNWFCADGERRTDDA